MRATTRVSLRFLIFTVGNIPYEATEEQLKDVFSEVGPVVTFRFAFVIHCNYRNINDYFQYDSYCREYQLMYSINKIFDLIKDQRKRKEWYLFSNRKNLLFVKINSIFCHIICNAVKHLLLLLFCIILNYYIIYS